MRRVLVAHRPAHLRLGNQSQRGRERVARLREKHLIEVGQRHHQLDVVLRNQGSERGDVARAVDARHQGECVRVVERRCHRVGIGGDRCRARAPEGRDDVDALPGAGEEDRSHGRQRNDQALECSAGDQASGRRAARPRRGPCLGPHVQRTPGNAAKIRLVLDLRAALPEEGRLRVLDVGCGGRHFPLNLWEPLLPVADRLDVTGIDLAFLEETRARAADLGFPIDIQRGSVLEVEQQFGTDAFDVVATTQVLEHIREWRKALRGIAAVLRPGGLLLLTCDNGDLVRPAGQRVRLAGKRAYARLAERVPSVTRVGRRFVSGDWERAQRLEELRRGAHDAGLEVERIAYYGLGTRRTRGAVLGRGCSHSRSRRR